MEAEAVALLVPLGDCRAVAVAEALGDSLADGENPLVLLADGDWELEGEADAEGVADSGAD